MNLLRSVVMAFSMFSRLPMPRVEWKKENMQYMLAMLPLVGCVEGGLLLLWWEVAQRLNLGPILFAAGMTAIPILFTGGIHLDGFCDTVDALSSHAEPEKKRKILKDPCMGAFAAIYLAVYLLVEFALYTETTGVEGERLLLCLIPVLGRTASGFAGVCFPVSGEQGLLSTFHTSARKGPALALLGLWCVLGSWGVLRVWAPIGGAMLTVTVLGCGYVYRVSRREFGGMSGDLAGYLFQLVRLAMLACVILMQKGMGV